jgi:leader peptidase (prepilin peptidase)/N-methyltransferase
VTVVAVVFGAAVGLVGGWFLPGPVYRLAVPFDEPDRSTCPNGHPLGHWLALARCRTCGVRYGPPPWATALAAAIAGAVVGGKLDLSPESSLFLGLSLVGVLLGAVDLNCHRLPHIVVVPSIAVSVPLLALIASLNGEWHQLWRALLGATAMGAFFLVLYLLPGPGGGLGFGDVTLSVLLGLYLGWRGWDSVFIGALLPWLLNAPVVVVYLVTRQAGRKGSVPVGPAMLASALVAIGVSGWVNVLVRS